MSSSSKTLKRKNDHFEREQDDPEFGHELKKPRLSKLKLFPDSILDSTIHPLQEDLTINVQNPSVFSGANVEELDKNMLEMEELVENLADAQGVGSILNESNEANKEGMNRGESVSESNFIHISILYFLDSLNGEINLNLPDATTKRTYTYYRPEQIITFLECVKKHQDAHSAQGESKSLKEIQDAVNKELKTSYNNSMTKTWISKIDKQPSWMGELEDTAQKRKAKVVKKVHKNVLYSEELERELVEYVTYHRERGVTIYPKNF